MVWKDIPGFSRYLINENGEIWSLFKDDFRKTYVGRGGFMRVSLINDAGKSKGLLVSNLVANAFCDKGLLAKMMPLCVHAKDGDNTNIRAENLVWWSKSLCQHRSRRQPSANSPYKGVRRVLSSPNKAGERRVYWSVRLTMRRRIKYMGCFRDPESAARCYNGCAGILYGEDVRLNVIPAPSA